METKTLYVYDHENQAVQDAYAMLTANILIRNHQKTLNTICISSCNPDEGKTSLAIGVAISMAQAGWRVLLVDGDMRKPAAAKRMNQGISVGLSNYLMGEIELTDALSETNLRNFTYFSCGNAHPNPIELLCSTNFKIFMANVKNSYDIVIFDTPALLSVGDGTVIASNVDVTLLVVRMGLTTLKCLKRVKAQLEESNVQILGVVLNRVKKRDYKRYFGSYNYFFNAKRFYNNSLKVLDLPTDVHIPPQNAAKL